MTPRFTHIDPANPTSKDRVKVGDYVRHILEPPGGRIGRVVEEAWNEEADPSGPPTSVRVVWSAKVRGRSWELPAHLVLVDAVTLLGKIGTGEIP